MSLHRLRLWDKTSTGSGNRVGVRDVGFDIKDRRLVKQIKLGDL